MFSGYVEIYRRRKSVRGATRGPRGRGRALLPRGCLVSFLTSTPSLVDCICSKNEPHEGFFPFGFYLIFLFQCFAEKEYQTGSKRNETFARIFLGTNAIQETWVEVRDATRRPRGRRARPHPCGPLMTQPTYFFRLYIPLYPKNIQESHETTFPPPQPSVPVRSHLGACSGAPPEGASITEGF